VSQTRRHFHAFSAPKIAGQINEDSYQYSSKGTFALSDGASISFDSASWSKLLVRRYAKRPDFSPEWLSGAITEFAKQYDRDSLPWMKQASFDRGSFASLLGVRVLDHGGSLQVLAIGDSLAVLCDGDEIIATHPYQKPEQFAQSPQLLSTSRQENAFLDDLDIVYDIYADWTFSGLTRPALLCMTDALGHWVLSMRANNRSPVATLRGIKKPRDFSKFVEEERASGRLKRDDTTLLSFLGKPRCLTQR
jgi:hypothetical protein